MYNDYLQNIIITYSSNVIICPRIEYLYANIIDISIFVIFGMTYYVNMSLMDPAHTVMQTSMWPHCVLTAWGLWTPFRVSSDLQV